MSKSRKNKWKNLPSTVRTCLIGAVAFLAIGLILFVFGRAGGASNAEDIKTVPATIVSVDRVSRNLPASQEEELKKQGYDSDYINYELKVVCSFTAEGEEQTCETREPYDRLDKLTEGGTMDISYTVKNGKVIVNPEKNSTYMFFGIVLIVLGILCGLIAYVLSPRRKH